jgi:starvation-inducible DNA-binding protein
MRNSSSDSAFYITQASASVTLSPLDELLTHSIRLRDLYRSARLQSAEMPSSRLRVVFDGHYKEQLRLVDVLVDRLRMLGGVHHISAGEFLNGSEVFHGLRSHRMRNRLFRDLLESHDSILTAARPSGKCDKQDDISWIRDFAVGQVVISNELQSQIICELMLGRVDHPSVQTPAAMLSD